MYERPRTTFVAGFVGTSNLLEPEAAQRLLGRAGVWTVRPEKIRIEAPNTPVAPDERAAYGTVVDVEYLGPLTRVVIELQVGGRLTALQQNVRSDSAAAEALRGTEVQLSWRQDAEYEVAG